MRSGSTLVAAALAIAAIAAAGIGVFEARRGGTKPATLEVRRDQNVLLVTIDTLRADVLGMYGGRARTPNLDALAAHGARFDFAHAHAPLTLPSHVSIMTGLYPYQHGIRDNSGYRVPAAMMTLAARLKAEGFATGAFVGGFPVAAQFGLDAGFDEYDDRFGRTQGPEDLRFAERRAAAVIAPAREWVARQRGRWFAWVHLYDPHAPYRPPAPFDSEYASDLYAGEVAYTDSALGPLFDVIRDVSRARPTLVVVTADHGEARGDHGEATHGVFAYESTLRVPLVMAQLAAPAAAGQVSGRQITAPVRHVDVLPTVLELVAARAAAPGDNTDEIAGRSLRDLLDGREETASARPSYFEAVSATLNRGWAPLRGILVGHRKYIDLPIPELYDLASDPHEVTNLAGSERAQMDVLEAQFRALHAPLPGARQTETADVQQRLRSLGYVSGTSAVKSHYTERDDPKMLVDIDQALVRGVDLTERGQTRDAIDAYRAILERRPDMPVASLHLAFLYWKIGDTQSAIATLRRARDAGARNPSLDTELGLYLAETGAVEDAMPLLSQAASGDAADVDAVNALGIAYARAGDPARALAAFERALKLDRSNHMAEENIGTVQLSRGRLDAARAAFAQAREMAPDSAAAWAGLGVVALKAGDRDGAIANWKKAVSLDPANFDALFNVGTTLLDAGRPGEARPYLEQFVRTAPEGRYARDVAGIRAVLARISEAKPPRDAR
ncbi:MAG TPA: sulfatase-like hydrolase/transferase [Vicinamibacterales bacterium]|jgi:arylsulfatase A-like enzyme/Flp pilus assembly protein TadD|nr:sulfatase-like hydrolase/transferase [Vicinamibacterales bacterium]